MITYLFGMYQVEKMLSHLVLTLCIATALVSCHQGTTDSIQSANSQVEQIVLEYFATFSERSDWDKLCSFYREDVEFIDVMLQLHLDSLWQFKRFYNWDGEGDRFQKLSPDQDHLTLTTVVVDDGTAVARGRVNPFYYDGHLIDTDWGMEFTIWLYFDENIKIIKQIDWMEYDSYTLESMIKRCRENGFEAIPDWLDLSMDSKPNQGQ